jgi:predicted permease
MKLLETIKKRWDAETPEFFKGIKKLALSLGTPAMAIILANQSLSLELDDNILSICKYAVTVCIAMGMTSQLTMVPPTINK